MAAASEAHLCTQPQGRRRLMAQGLAERGIGGRLVAVLIQSQVAQRVHVHDFLWIADVQQIQDQPN